jgi:2-methylcitrate dehydratase PrpD
MRDLPIMAQTARPEITPFRPAASASAPAVQARQGPVPPPDGFSREVCAAYEGWRFEILPAEVVHRVKLFVLDTFGVIAAASQASGIPALNRQLSAWEASGVSTALIGKWRASPPTAALANGAAAHALDFDDNHDPGRVHSYAVILPAALAAAEATGGIGGKAFITALAIGIELQCRLGLASPGSLARGWHPTTVLGTIGASVAVAHVLGLHGEPFLHAAALGYHQAAGTRQALNDGALAKRLGPGFSARNGVTAGFLAAVGLTGPARFLEGEAGLFSLYERNEAEPQELLAGLTRRWELLTHSMKPYPCCRCTHNAIAIGIALHREGLTAEAIASAAIGMGRTNVRVVGAPYEPQRNSTVHAQFNASYCLASALVNGRIGLDSFQAPQITDPRVAALAGRVSVVDDPQIDPAAMSPTRAMIMLRDGRTLERFFEFMQGSPEEPMSDAEALEKFSACMAAGLGADRAAIQAIAQTILCLDNLPDVVEMVRAFPCRPT